MEARKKTLVLCGMTGHGKSSAGNSILGNEYFRVSDDTESCTFKVEHASCDLYSIYDTVGFGDTNTSEAEVKKQLAEAIVNVDNREGTIDAFLLVFSFSKRMTHFKECLETMVALFGPYVLESTLLLLIDRDRKTNLSELLAKINEQMPEVRSIICESRRQSVVKDDWIVLWDNLRPFPNQSQELAARLRGCRQYTHSQYEQHVREQQARLQVVTDLRGRLLLLTQKYKQKISMEKLEACAFIQKNYAESEAKAMAWAEQKISQLKKQLTELSFWREKQIADRKRAYQIAVAAENGRYQTEKVRTGTLVQAAIVRGKTRPAAESQYQSIMNQNVQDNFNTLQHLKSTLSTDISNLQLSLNQQIAQHRNTIASIQNQMRTREIKESRARNCVHCSNPMGYLFVEDIYGDGVVHLHCVTPYFLAQRKKCSVCKMPVLCPAQAVEKTPGVRTHRRCLGNVKQIVTLCPQGHNLIAIEIQTKACKCKSNTQTHQVFVCVECQTLKCPNSGK